MTRQDSNLVLTGHKWQKLQTRPNSSYETSDNSLAGLLHHLTTPKINEVKGQAKVTGWNKCSRDTLHGTKQWQHHNQARVKSKCPKIRNCFIVIKADSKSTLEEQLIYQTSQTPLTDRRIPGTWRST